MRSSSLFFALFLSAISCGCSGAAFTADPSLQDQGLAGEGGLPDDPPAEGGTMSAGGPGTAGASGSGSGSGSGGSGSGGSGGSSAGASGSISGAGGPGASGSTGSAGSSSGGVGQSGAGQSGSGSGGGSGGPYPGCSRKADMAECSPSQGVLSFRYECGPQPTCGQDLDSAACACHQFPGDANSLCCPDNVSGCAVSAGNPKCDENHPYYYGCGFSAPSPSPGKCVKIGGGEFCCSDPYLG